MIAAAGSCAFAAFLRRITVVTGSSALFERVVVLSEVDSSLVLAMRDLIWLASSAGDCWLSVVAS